MNILLIRPPVPKHTIGLKNIMICEPLELEYVAAGLYGHNVQIFDMILERGLANKLKSFKPDVVGSSCYITGVNEVIKIFRMVKLYNPGCLTIAGGVQASLVPEDFCDYSVDCIVIGDGTTIMPELIKSFENNIPLDEISGLAIPISEDKVKYTARRQYMPNPDSLPFPRRDLVNHLKNRYYYLFHQPVALMKTTWGCWYKCNFCYTWQITEGKSYSRSPESIVDELEQIEVEDVYIVDDIFLINKSRLSKLAALIRERNISKRYLVYARADFISQNEDVIKEWSKIGLSAVFIGLEAATNPELESMNKQCDVDFNYRAVQILRQNGIDTYGSLIPQPDYLPEDWLRLQTFIEVTGLYYINISPLTPMPGTNIWSEYEEKITVSRKAHGLWDLSHCVLPTKMPLKEYYRHLLKTYAKAVLDIKRANKLSLRTRPPVYSIKYLRLWFGALKIYFQFRFGYRHHSNKQIKIAKYRGRELPQNLRTYDKMKFNVDVNINKRRQQNAEKI